MGCGRAGRVVRHARLGSRFFGIGLFNVVWIEAQRRRVHAITQSRWLGSIVEYVTKMRIASCAKNLGSFHEKTIVAFGRNSVGRNGGRVTGPARSAVKLGFRSKQGIAATNADISAGGFCIPVLAREGAFGAMLPRNAILIRGQLFFPVAIGFNNFLDHVYPFSSAP